MTQSEPQAVATQGTTYYQPQYEPVQPSVRGMPTTARGPRGALEARSLLDLAALASSAGTTRAEITGLLDDFQEAALNAITQAAPKLIERNKRVTQARIAQIGVRIERLRRITLVTPAQTGWRAVLGVPQQQQADPPQYVNVDDVKLIISEAIAALSSSD